MLSVDQASEAAHSLVAPEPSALAIPDVACNISAFLDDKELERLYVLGLLPELARFADSQQFWHARVETISELRLIFKPEHDWKQTYRILTRKLGWNDVFTFANEEDDVVTLDVLWGMGFIPESYDVALSAKHGCLQGVQWLLDEGSAHPGGLPRYTLMYPHMEAIKAGHLEIVQALLADSRVDVTCTYETENALTLACKRGHIEIVRLLLARPAVDPTWQGSKALNHAIKHEDLSVLGLLLLDGRANPAVGLCTLLHTAVMTKRTDVVARLLRDPRVDPNSRNGSAIAVAVTSGDGPMIDLLLSDKRVDPSLGDGTVLMVALTRQDRDVVRRLLSDERMLVCLRNWDARTWYRAHSCTSPELIELVHAALD